MIKLLNYDDICNILKTADTHQFEEDVLISNIKVLYPKCKNITIHNDLYGRRIALLII